MQKLLRTPLVGEFYHNADSSPNFGFNGFLPMHPKSPIFQMVHRHCGISYSYGSQRKGRREEKMPPRQTELKINLKTI